MTALKNVMVDQNSNMLLKGAINQNLERFASAEGGKLKYSVKKNPQSRTRINYKIIQLTFDAEEKFKPMLVASKKSHHCHIPASQLMLLGMHKTIDRLPNLFPQWMSWQIAGDNMQALQNWKEAPVVFIKIIKQFSYGIL